MTLDLDGRADDAIPFLPAAVRDEWTAQGPIAAHLTIRRTENLAAVSGEVLAPLTSLERMSKEPPVMCV